jgi:hypothetical protein
MGAGNGAKFDQDPLCGSSEWHAAYATLRNSIEGMNGFFKDGAYEAHGDPQRRRIRGVAAQSVFVGLPAAGRRTSATSSRSCRRGGGGALRLPCRRGKASIERYPQVRSSSRA